MKKILIVVGTRPNYIKVTGFKKLADADLEFKVVHTGQHFDQRMADVFFDQLDLQPDFFLGIDTALSVEEQKKEIILKLQRLIHDYLPDLILVVGDVNSTLAAAMAGKEMNIKLAHVESGLRSFDSSMPEEYNRIETDKISDLFFITEQSGIDNLLNEGVDKGKIYFVGNTMIDTMVAFAKQIDASDILAKLDVQIRRFVLMTIHRPATVDHKDGLLRLLTLIRMVASSYKVVFPMHPRTLKNIERFGLKNDFESIIGLLLTEPMDYFAFQKLVKNCKLILTDSGGIQEESTFLRVPCLTLRPNTERPVTVSLGSNKLVPFELNTIAAEIKSIEVGTFKQGVVPPLWDGNATKRIIEVIRKTI
jgi:UDP-N-acetylglucosamine 2-epimerase (non-hydrolysing)